MKNRLVPIRYALIAGTMGLSLMHASAQDYVTLTRGGGFTGNTAVYRISRSGEVARGAGGIEPTLSEFARLRKGKAKKFFRETRTLLNTQSFNYPGNTYTAIALTEAGKEIKWVWGDGSHATPSGAVELYENIQESLNRLTFRKELRK